MKNDLVAYLQKAFPYVAIRSGEPLWRHTTFRIGGNTPLFIEPFDRGSLVRIVSLFCREGISWRVLGCGSNLLVSDDGVGEPVISMRRMEGIGVVRVEKDRVFLRVDSGVKTKKLLSFCVRHGYSGCEFLAGIPASVGGAIVLNAGTAQGCMADIVRTVDVVSTQGVIEEYDYVRDFSPGYRSSEIPSNFVVVSATLILQKGNAENIRKKIKAIMSRRLHTQPVGKPSAGCIFKNPSSALPAGMLIDKCGFKGFRIGGAAVSTKHANWIINTGTATFNDVNKVMEKIRSEVRKKFGVDLEEEIRIWR